MVTMIAGTLFVEKGGALPNGFPTDLVETVNRERRRAPIPGWPRDQARKAV